MVSNSISPDLGALSSGDARAHKNGMSMIIVMGVTGSGKSYLINRLAGAEVVDEGADLDACTQKCAMIPVEVGKSKVLFIDTPGFDDTVRTDSDILNEIAHMLAAQYQLGFELKGIIYVHRITDIKYAGCNVKTFEVFKRICGDGDALKNVLLITTRWNEVDEATGASRERQLREKFWAYMIARGSCMSRFHGDRASAISLASQLLNKSEVVLTLQREMVDEAKQLHETAAGSFVNNGLTERRKNCLKEIEQLEKLRNDLRDNDRMMRLQLEEDWARSRTKLREAEEQQASLHRNVAAEVNSEIRQEKKTKSRGLSQLLPLIPTALSILGMFVGIPPGSFDMLAGFVFGTDSSGEC